MPIPNEELQARYIGIRENVVPAVKRITLSGDPDNAARQASALKQFITEESDLSGLREMIAPDFPPALALSYGIDVGTVLGASIMKRGLQSQTNDNTICPTCKDAVVDLIKAARKFVQKVDDGRATSVESYGEFKAALVQLDVTHDGVDDVVEGGA